MLKSEWDVLSRRIGGVVEASTFLFQCRESDEAFSTNVLIEGCKQTADAIRNLSTYRDAMSSHAVEALVRFQAWWNKTADLNLTGFQGVMALTAVLAAFRSEFDHHLADHEAIVRSRVARAFLHLKRSLVADESIRCRWEDAFAQGEKACEKLGALHLLLHGILSFKANGERERTDLILGQRLIIDDAIIAATDGLVLTEWKLVKTGDNAEETGRIAKSQAQLYSGGSLAGFELSSERYIVLIGEQELPEIPDDREGTVLYKTISIALNREVPSKAAARRRA